MTADFFFPVPIEAVKVTKDNLEEVAKWCGGKVLEAQSRRDPNGTDKYVFVPVAKHVRISWAFPGMYVSKRLYRNKEGELKPTFSVFKRDYFAGNFFETPREAANKTWEKYYGQISSLPPVEESVAIAVSIIEGSIDEVVS